MKSFGFLDNVSGKNKLKTRPVIAKIKNTIIILKPELIAASMINEERDRVIAETILTKLTPMSLTCVG
jgi:hypothetical protein